MAKLGFVLGAFFFLAACKQGVGDRCEVNDDCDVGLTCSTGSDRVCFNPNQQAPDAPPVNGPDAFVVVNADAPIVMPDAPPAIDAPGAPDAGGPD